MASILEESKKAKGVGKFFTVKKIIVVLVILVVSAGVYYYLKNRTAGADNATVQKKEWTVKKSDLQVAIESDGKVVAEDGVELSFSVSGDALEVKEVFVAEGQNIKKGDQIASVKTDDLEYDLRRAYASYQSTLASYNEKLAGATDEEISKAKSSIEQSEISLEQAKISLEKTKKSGEDKIKAAEDALADAKEAYDKNQNISTGEDVRDAYDGLADLIKSISISLEDIFIDSDNILGVDNEAINDEFENNLGVVRSVSLSEAVVSYNMAKDEKESLNSYAILLSHNSSTSDIDAASEKTSNALNLLEAHLYKMQVMLDNSITSTAFTQSALDAFKSTINSNRSNINSKITSVRNSVQAVDDAKDDVSDYADEYQDALDNLENVKIDAEQDNVNAETSIRAKELSLEQTKLSYNELLAPLTESEMASIKSSLTSSSITLDKARNDLNKAIIVSPIDGEVAMLNYKPGDIILNDNTDPVVEIINNDTLFIEVDIEEADINKISVGQKAYATFDALDGLKLDGSISFISMTSNTDNSGIVTYQVRIVINKPEGVQVREGMTAFVDFVISEANDVLVIPVSAVRNVDGKPSVELLAGGWTTVITGFTDGKNVEVISGLSEGDQVVY